MLCWKLLACQFQLSMSWVDFFFNNLIFKNNYYQTWKGTTILDNAQWGSI
jgi:hypothetical protein